MRPLAYTITVLLATFMLLNAGFSYYVSSSVTELDEEAQYLNTIINAKELQLETEKQKAAFSAKVLDIHAILSNFPVNYSKIGLMDFAYLIASEAEKHDIDPYLILALIKTESSFNKRVISHKGAVGLMQLLPGTAFYISNKTEGLTLNKAKELFDPEMNVKLGVSYFSYLINKYNNVKYAIIAYNFGPGNMTRRLRSGSPLPSFYYNKVMKNYRLMMSYSSRA
ncbi:lytic transglycosylase domain-containing protein [Limisalsivibrio acetivorans]|uniref:lytic transglycosylase domain-containing protein n=1 Tax=Limisalsivibrio acetivorans TaxID=1304888 RepID=UPI0003B517DD|nr:lytic transglycosylase domain-containing protein [Limisalsivibrio acetivorans]